MLMDLIISVNVAWMVFLAGMIANHLWATRTPGDNTPFLA